MSNVIQLRFNAIKLLPPFDVSGEVTTLVNLVLPRPAIATRAATATYTLKKGHLSLARAPLYENGLLKETVRGDFGLKVAITKPQKHPRLDALIRGLLAEGFEGLGKLLTDGLAMKQLAPALRVPFDLQADELDDTDPIFIATAGIDLNADTLSPQLLSFDLKLTKSLRIPSPPSHHRSPKPKYTTLKKGTTIGTLKLNSSPL